MAIQSLSVNLRPSPWPSMCWCARAQERVGHMLESWAFNSHKPRKPPCPWEETLSCVAQGGITESARICQQARAKYPGMAWQHGSPHRPAAAVPPPSFARPGQGTPCPCMSGTGAQYRPSGCGAAPVRLPDPPTEPCPAKYIEGKAPSGHTMACTWLWCSSSASSSYSHSRLLARVHQVPAIGTCCLLEG